MFNRFFDLGHFLTYGFAFYGSIFEIEAWSKVTCNVFPVIFACDVTIRPFSSVQTESFLCTYKANLANAKILIVLWSTLFLQVWSLVGTLLQDLLLLWPDVQRNSIKRKSYFIFIDTIPLLFLPTHTVTKLLFWFKKLIFDAKLF